MDDVSKTFQTRLRGILVERNIYEADLCKKAGISTGAINRWLWSGELPNARSLKKLCEALHESADYLLGINE